MFDIGWSELTVVVIIILIVVGPSELPNVIRGLRKMMAGVRKVRAEFQGHIDDMVREADVKDIINQQGKDLKDSLSDNQEWTRTIKDSVEQLKQVGNEVEDEIKKSQQEINEQILKEQEMSTIDHNDQTNNNDHDSNHDSNHDSKTDLTDSRESDFYSHEATSVRDSSASDSSARDSSASDSSASDSSPSDSSASDPSASDPSASDLTNAKSKEENSPPSVDPITTDVPVRSVESPSLIREVEHSQDTYVPTKTVEDSHER